MTKRLLQGFLLIVTSLVLVACRHTGHPGQANAVKPGVKTYDVRGVIQKVEEEGAVLSIRHEEIKGYMAAMTMPFDVKNPAESAGLQPGDKVQFKLVVTEEEGWIEQIQKIGTGEVIPSNARQNVRRVRDVEPLEIGDKMPNYPFINEQGKRIELKNLNGQAYAFTFIFTRCPFPNFCPRMSSNFLAIQRALAEDPSMPKNWQLFSITIDPEYDTAERLKKYAQRYPYDPKKWSFLTGAMIDIDAITEQFGLGFAWRTGSLAHNLRTVVVDRNGRIQQIFIGNEWKVSDLVQEMKTAAAVKPVTTSKAP